MMRDALAHKYVCNWVLIHQPPSPRPRHRPRQGPRRGVAATERGSSTSAHIALSLFSDELTFTWTTARNNRQVVFAARVDRSKPTNLFEQCVGKNALTPPPAVTYANPL